MEQITVFMCETGDVIISVNCENLIGNFVKLLYSVSCIMFQLDLCYELNYSLNLLWEQS